MYPVKTATAVTSKPAYTEGGAPGYFTNGNAVAGISATVPGEHWFNMTQEELLNVIRAAGLIPSATDDRQLTQAVQALIAAQAVEVEPASETVAGIVERATEAEVAAGEDTERYVCPAHLMAALVAGLAGVARVGAVNAYTRQQYAAPVVLVGQAGAVALDAELHQDVDITAIAAVSFGAPEHSARGMYMTMTLRAATALGITWDATVFKASTSSASVTPDVTLPTACVAGKAMILQFRCLDGARWLLLGKSWEV